MITELQSIALPLG